MPDRTIRDTIDAAEKERTRWARELHDETLQAFAILRMRLASALREDSPEQLEQTAQAAVDQIDEEIAKLRRLISELRPAALDTIGLAAALETLADQHAEVTGVPVSCRVDLPDGDDRPTPALETAVYRLAQEALNNVRKHSRAEHAEIGVHVEGDTIEVEVHDDGIGFSPGLVREGFGLVGMRERTALLGGVLSVDSKRGSGTTVRAQVPMVSRRR